MARKISIKGLYYITHIDNLPSIMEHGILSHFEVLRRELTYRPIYDRQIMTRRQERFVGQTTSLWSYANLYFNPRNPMMYRVIHESDKAQLAIIHLDRKVLDIPDVQIALGNAASAQTAILPAKDGLPLIHEMWPTIQSEYWKEEDGSKRKIMAEALIPTAVPPNLIRSVYVASIPIAGSIRANILSNASVPVVAEPNLFFQPAKTLRVSPRISIVEGDMFFSQRQTLTISVNTVGVMGKGLASRTKYQFPDVYVEYEERCKSKELEIGKPWLYKREASFDSELADSPRTLQDANAEKWFLLFPTKRHWREPSRIDDIEMGLVWLAENHDKLGIRSLAVPALGCGLGGLSWKDVGPLMCRYLEQMHMTVSIYLPREVEVPSSQLTPEFLLGGSNQ